MKFQPDIQLDSQPNVQFDIQLDTQPELFAYRLLILPGFSLIIRFNNF